jgi:hypothetical protein
MKKPEDYSLSKTLHPSIPSILFQLERLRRNFQTCISTYDRIAFFELSHSLRIWTDLKLTLPTIAPAFGTKRVFKSGTPSRKLMKRVKEKNFVIAYMPGGVSTLAGRGQLVSAPELPPDVDFTLGGTISVETSGAATVSSFWFSESTLDDSQVAMSGHPEISKYSYVDWMGAEAVRLWFPDGLGASRTLMISREVLINRIANTLDGSHPSAVPDPRTGKDKADPAINKLLQYTVLGVPLPYFVLLKIAKDILDNTGELLGIPKPETFA